MLPVLTTNAESERTFNLMQGLLYAYFCDFKNLWMGCSHHRTEADSEAHQTYLKVHWSRPSKVYPHVSKA